MSTRVSPRSWIAALSAVLLASGSAGAGPGGGGGHGGGAHAGGGFGHAGPSFRGSGTRPYGLGRYARSGASGYYHGGYYHGGYGWRGYYGRNGRFWGWGGVGLGLYLAYLPWDYETYWWNGSPYYYANDLYYVWDGDLGEYEAVDPPTGLTETAPSDATPAPLVSEHLFAYPKSGQSEAQQQQDRNDCRRWAIAQTGMDPQQTGPAPETKDPESRRSYLRAEAACLEGRNYSVR